MILIVLSPNYIMDVLKDLRGNYLKTDYITAERAIIAFETPLRAIVANLYDKIKSVSQGYASLNYKILGYRPGNLVKMEIYKTIRNLSL